MIRETKPYKEGRMNEQAMKSANILQINTIGGATEIKKIARGQVDVLKHGKGAKITCDSGLLWVTIENDQVDHILSERDSLVIASDATVLLSGLQSASYRIA
jgi:hypothetical protein